MTENNAFETALRRLSSVLEEKVILAAKDQRANERIRIPEYVAATLSRESAIRDAISQSCVEWVENGAVPIMSQTDAMFFYDRLFYAFGFGRLLSESGFEWPWGENDLLRWLLIDSWEQITCLLWKHNLENNVGEG